MAETGSWHVYTAPHTLRSDNADVRRALVVGSCAIGSLNEHVAAAYGVECDFFNVNHGCFLPDAPPRPLADYDFQIIQIPIRTLIPEADLMRLGYADVVGYQALFDHSRTLLEFAVNNALRWADEHGLPAFVTNFLTPQQNPLGRLLPRYDLRNMVYFVEELNRALAECLVGHGNAYLLDSDHLSAIFGKRRIQDDSVALYCHGALISSYDEMHDGNRLEAPPATVAESLSADVPNFLLAIWEEAVAMWRTLRQIESIKLIIVDLDDTLWRGVVAEGNEISSHTTEGWPIGFVEALLCAKRRGLMLAVASKNDTDRIEALWPSLYGGRMEPSDFASWKVNWRPKVENIRQILSEINILPKNVLFIDDNPVERAAAAEAFPDMRIIGADPYALRRIVLWSPETQVGVVTEESIRRTEMIQSQIEREANRAVYSAEDFLRSLAPTVDFFDVPDTSSARFARSFELLNKTNQFNTTGKRWTQPELEHAVSDGLRVRAFTVQDKYTDYGIVGVVLSEGTTIAQFVMSCRVFGLGVEDAVVALIRSKDASGRSLTALLTPTAVNGPAQAVWPRLGFVENNGTLSLPATVEIEAPSHIAIKNEILEYVAG